MPASRCRRWRARAVTEALLKSLDTLQGDLKLGVIGTIGRRHDPAADRALAKLLADADARTADSAAVALGCDRNARVRRGTHRGISRREGLRPQSVDRFRVASGRTTTGQDGQARRGRGRFRSSARRGGPDVLPDRGHAERDSRPRCAGSRPDGRATEVVRPPLLRGGTGCRPRSSRRAATTDRVLEVARSGIVARATGSADSGIGRSR